MTCFLSFYNKTPPHRLSHQISSNLPHLTVLCVFHLQSDGITGFVWQFWTSRAKATQSLWVESFALHRCDASESAPCLCSSAWAENVRPAQEKCLHKTKSFLSKTCKKNCNKLFLLFLVKGYDKPKHYVSYRLLICKRPCTGTNYVSNIKAWSYITQSLWGLPGQHSDSSKSQINSLTQSDVTMWCFRQVKRSVSVGEKVTGTCEPPEQWWFSFTVQLPPSARGNILAISSPPFLSQPPAAANYLEYHFSLTSISCPRGSWSYWCTKWMDCHGNWNCTWREILLIFFAVDGPINPGYFMQKKPELWQLGLQLTAVFVIGWSLHLFSL